MLCSSCLIQLTLWTLLTNVKYKKYNCVLHPTIEIVGENHARTKRHRDRLLQNPTWNTLQSDRESVLIIMLGTVFQPLGHTSFHEIIQTTFFFLAYENSMQSIVASPTEVRIYQILCLLLCCYPVILSKKEIRLMWSVIHKSMLAVSFHLAIFLVPSAGLFNNLLVCLSGCLQLGDNSKVLLFCFLKTVTIFALLSPLECPPYLTKSWTQSLMAQRFIYIITAWWLNTIWHCKLEYM